MINNHNQTVIFLDMLTKAVEESGRIAKWKKENGIIEDPNRCHGAPAKSRLHEACDRDAGYVVALHWNEKTAAAMSILDPDDKRNHGVPRGFSERYCEKHAAKWRDLHAATAKFVDETGETYTVVPFDPDNYR